MLVFSPHTACKNGSLITKTLKMREDKKKINKGLHFFQGNILQPRNKQNPPSWGVNQILRFRIGKNDHPNCDFSRYFNLLDVTVCIPGIQNLVSPGYKI